MADIDYRFVPIRFALGPLHDHLQWSWVSPVAIGGVISVHVGYGVMTTYKYTGVSFVAVLHSI